MAFSSMITFLLLTALSSNAFNLTYPVSNTTITVYPDSNFTVRWTSSQSDPRQINIRIQANTRDGNPQELCTNVTISTNYCVVPAEKVLFNNGPDWEMLVVDSAHPGTSDGTPGTGSVIFKSQPFALYLYGSSSASSTSTGSSASATAMSTASASTSTGGVDLVVAKNYILIPGMAIFSFLMNNP